LNLAPRVGEDAAFQGKKKFVALFVCTGVGALKYMVLSFKMKFAMRTQMGIQGSRGDVLLLGTSVDPAVNVFGAGDMFEGVQGEEGRLEGFLVQRVPGGVRPAVLGL
jgi:hypothetical protein